MVFGLTIKKTSDFSSMQNELEDIKKTLNDYQNLRPSMDLGYGGYGIGGAGTRGSGYGTYAGYVPNYSIQNRYFEDLALKSDIFMTSINALRNKIFRRGYKIKQVSELPNEQQLTRLRNILKHINTNRQSLKDVLKMSEQDLNIFDDQYLIAMKDYIFGFEGEIVNSKTKEIIRANPKVMSIITDSEGRLGHNIEGEKVYVSPTNRGNLIKHSEAEAKGFKDENGLQLQLACYRGISFHNEKSMDIFYLKDEVVHASKHNPTPIYGMSPINSIWMKIITLIEQDRYLLLNYQKGRPPRGMLVVPTTNFESTKKAWESLKAAARKDPHAINPFLYDSRDSSQKIEWIEFMKPLGDMQFIETRNEMRKTIAGRYGVMPLFLGDLKDAGGLNAEDLQITVTNQAVEEGQKLYNEKIFPWILKQFEITDYSLNLEEPEEKDEVIEAKLMGVQIDNAVKMSQMGFEVEFDKEADEFKFSETAINPASSQGIFGGPTPTSLEGVDKEFLDILSLQTQKEIKKKVNDLIIQDREELTKQGITFDLKKEDLKEFISKELFDRTFDGLTKQKSDQIKKLMLTGALQKTSLTKMINQVMDLGVTKNQAELITRTENSVLKNSVKEFNFKKAVGFDKMKFKWLGPRDSRTSAVSKEIVKKSAKGLPLDDLKKLVRKTSENFGFKPDRDFYSHPNQRHTFSKVVT
jgi:hypothetical protein